jgi:glycosyltransferase involved in cell wall biosynthesis
MRVLYLVTAYPRHDGDVITPWLVQAIRELRKIGVEVDVLAPSYRGLTDHTIDGVRVHRFRYAPARIEDLTHDQTTPDRLRTRPASLALVPGYVAAGTFAAARLLRTGRFDLIHALWPLPHGLMAWPASRASNVPLVCTFFGVELRWLQSEWRLFAPVMRQLVRACAATIVISSHTAHALRELVPDAQPTWIPFAAALEPPTAVAYRRAQASEPFELLFVGRLVERKGVHVLLQALAHAPFRANVRLEVLGDGPERTRLEDDAARLGLRDRVRFRGLVTQREKEESLARCDALVLPAVIDDKGDTEGQGVVVLEAMLCAKPVIASRIGGIVDMVREQETGWLVPPEDPTGLQTALAQCIADPSQAARMGRAGREHALAAFSGSAIARRQASCYRACLERGTT